jgi:hypothetical protein
MKRFTQHFATKIEEAKANKMMMITSKKLWLMPAVALALFGGCAKVADGQELVKVSLQCSVICPAFEPCCRIPYPRPSLDNNRLLHGTVGNRRAALLHL